MATETKQEILPYEPSPIERTQQGLANLLKKTGISNYSAQNTADKLTTLADFIPILGDVQGVREGSFMFKEGDKLMGTTMIGASLIPFIPGTILFKKAEKLQNKIKKAEFDEARELRNAQSGESAANTAATKHKKAKVTAQKQLDDLILNNTPKDASKELAENLNKQIIFHGSRNKGIESLKLPEDIANKLQVGQRNPSSGGIYTVKDVADPRLTSFSEKGSAYALSPNFKRTLDIENMPKETEQSLEDMLNYVSRPSRTGTGPKRTEYQLDTMLRGGPGSVYKLPSNFSRNVADRLKELDYDSIMFPPRKMKGESETVLSLDPENLEITEEIPFNRLKDFIEEFSKKEYNSGGKVNSSLMTLKY